MDPAVMQGVGRLQNAESWQVHIGFRATRVANGVGRPVTCSSSDLVSMCILFCTWLCHCGPRGAAGWSHQYSWHSRTMPQLLVEGPSCQHIGFCSWRATGFSPESMRLPWWALEHASGTLGPPDLSASSTNLQRRRNTQRSQMEDVWVWSSYFVGELL